MTITITVTGHAERLLKALCGVADTTAEEIAREGVAAALNGFNYQRADSRGMMTALPQRDRTPVGPDLEPGEAECPQRRRTRSKYQGEPERGRRADRRRKQHDNQCRIAVVSTRASGSGQTRAMTSNARRTTTLQTTGPQRRRTRSECALNPTANSLQIVDGNRTPDGTSTNAGSRWPQRKQSTPPRHEPLRRTPAPYVTTTSS